MPSSNLEAPDAHVAPLAHHVAGAKQLSIRQAALKDGTPVTIIPITSGPASVPEALLKVLHAEFAAELERGCTYPMEEEMSLSQFEQYWFGTCAVVCIAGTEEGTVEEVLARPRDWEQKCLGSFYIKPNYPGRCSHVSNAGFLTCSISRGKGIGRVLGQSYLEYAPRLGYTYSVFNLVFENNVASCKIWDSLGFQVIGRVPKAARLRNSETLVDALIYGKEFEKVE